MAIGDEAQTCASSIDIARGVRLVSTMSERGFSVEDISSQIGVTARTLTRWRAGRPIEYSYVSTLSSVLSVSIAYFLFGFIGPLKENLTGHSNLKLEDINFNKKQDTEQQKKVEKISTERRINKKYLKLHNTEVQFLRWLRKQECEQRQIVTEKLFHDLCNTDGYEVFMRLEVDDIKLDKYESGCLIILRQLRPEVMMRLLREWFVFCSN